MSEIGLVDTVTVDDENARILVTVFLGPGRTDRNIPFRSPVKGMWLVPEIDDLVEVYESADGRKAARMPHTTSSRGIPHDLEAGEIAINADNRILNRKGYLNSHMSTGISNAEAGGYLNVFENENENLGWDIVSDTEIQPLYDGVYRFAVCANYVRVTSSGRNKAFIELEHNGSSLTARTRGVVFLDNNENQGNEGDAEFSTIISLEEGDSIKVPYGSESGSGTDVDIDRAYISISPIA